MLVGGVDGDDVKDTLFECMGIFIHTSFVYISQNTIINYKWKKNKNGCKVFSTR